jgi:hypothetical protein
MCGSYIYYINSALQGFGAVFDAVGDAILLTVHLYNAARQTNCLTKTWTDIEYLISQHDPKHLFVGNLPTERTDFFKRFLLAPGAGMLNFAKDKRDTGMVYSTRQKKHGWKVP